MYIFFFEYFFIITTIVFRIFEIDTIQISSTISASQSLYTQNLFVSFSGEIIFSKNEVEETLCYITNLAMLTNTGSSNAINKLFFGNSISLFENKALTGEFVFILCLICFTGFLIGPSFGEIRISFNLNMLVSNNTFESF